MTLRKCRRTGQLAVGAVFANRTARRWSCDARAGGKKSGGPAQFTEKDLSGLVVPRDAGSTATAVSLQGHDEHALHNAGLCVVSSCCCVLVKRAQQLS